MLGGELDHDPPASGGVQGASEGRQVGHVVGDVVAHHHVGPADTGSDIGPEAEDLGVVGALALGRLGEGGEHGVALVDSDDACRRRGEGQAGRSPADADVDHLAADG